MEDNKAIEKKSKFGRKVYHPKTKVDIVNMIISGEETSRSLSEMIHVPERTIRTWVEEVAPGIGSIYNIQNLEADVLQERADKLSQAARIVVISRMLELVKTEKNLGRLASVLKELRSTKEMQDPKGKGTVNNFFTQFVQEQINEINKVC